MSNKLKRRLKISAVLLLIVPIMIIGLADITGREIARGWRNSGIWREFKHEASDLFETLITSWNEE